jgi:hypothetical protein
MYQAVDTGPGIVASILGALVVLTAYRIAIGRRRLT